MAGTRHVRDEAANQLVEAGQLLHKNETATNIEGCPMASLTETLTVGPRGNVLLQDSNVIDHLAQFVRERIPERVVHAKGAGAFGYFEVTEDITEYTRAKVFEDVGKKTPIAIRFSPFHGEAGSGDVLRSLFGFAVKFYTEDGIWDIVGTNSPIFFLRDPILFPGIAHSQKRNPRTHLADANMYWDFVTLRPETTHQIMINFSDRGIPDGFRHMHGFGGHAFKLVNDDLQVVYVKFHMRTDQGIVNLTPERAREIQADDLDYSTRDLYNAIARGEFPSWTFCIQVMTFAQAEKFKWNPFDVTKVWPFGEFPLRRVGKLVLNKNPLNYHTQVEHIAFAPANMVPGIEPSPDKVLQVRMFTYKDAQRYRLGQNFQQLPINASKSPVHTYNRDGFTVTTPDEGPNYFPNSFNGPTISPRGMQSEFPLAGDVKRYNSKDADNYSQPAIFWDKCVDDAGRRRLVKNIANHMQLVTVQFIKDRAVDNFSKVNLKFGEMLRDALSRPREGAYSEEEHVDEDSK